MTAKNQVDEIIENANNQAYKVVSITPLTTGNSGQIADGGAGTSHTAGVLIVFEYVSGEDQST